MEKTYCLYYENYSKKYKFAIPKMGIMKRLIKAATCVWKTKSKTRSLQK